MDKVYLATSYTSYSKWWIVKQFVQWKRFFTVTKCLAKIATRYSEKVNFFSPITHSHLLTWWIPARLDTHTFWLNIDFEWVDACDEVWVYCQEGWQESYGVQEEIKKAQATGKPVYTISDDGEYKLWRYYTNNL